MIEAFAAVAIAAVPAIGFIYTLRGRLDKLDEVVKIHLVNIDIRLSRIEKKVLDD